MTLSSSASAQIANMLQMVDSYLDNHPFDRTGDMLWEAFGDNSMAQIRSFQNIAYTATRWTDLHNFIKNQMGKEGKTLKWNRMVVKEGEQERKRAGDHLLDDLDRLKHEAEQIAQRIGSSEPSVQTFTIALRLGRGWMRQITSQYLYRRQANQ